MQNNDEKIKECEYIELEAEPGVRLDAFASKASGLTRSFLHKLIDDGLVLVDSVLQKANYKLKTGQHIKIILPPSAPVDIMPQDIPLQIVYEDADIAIVNKPQGMVVHPAAGNPDLTLVNALLFHIGDLSGIGGEIRPGIVHRIDKDTSGLLVVAKNDMAHNALSAQLKKHDVSRVYWALLEGRLEKDEGTVCAPIGRHPVDRKKMAVVTNGREAVTHYRVLERLEGYTLIEARLETGRTHQIRVHMSFIGHPVAGDPVYGFGKNKLGLTGQALHAKQLRLKHPRTGEIMEFSAPLPEYFNAALGKLKSK